MSVPCIRPTRHVIGHLTGRDISSTGALLASLPWGPVTSGISDGGRSPEKKKIVGLIMFKYVMLFLT